MFPAGIMGFASITARYTHQTTHLRERLRIL